VVWENGYIYKCGKSKMEMTVDNTLYGIIKVSLIQVMLQQQNTREWYHFNVSNDGAYIGRFAYYVSLPYVCSSNDGLYNGHFAYYVCSPNQHLLLT